MKSYSGISYWIATGLIHGCVWITTIFMIVFWNRIPGKIPIHYNGAGEVTRWGGKGNLFVLVLFLFLVYVGHFIGIFFLNRGTTPEGLYSKRYQYLVNEEDMKFGVGLTKTYLAWTDASVLLLFVYSIFCSVTVRKVGGWLPFIIIGIFVAELIAYLVPLTRRKRLMQLRGMKAGREEADEEEKTVGDADGGYEEPSYDDMYDSPKDDS